MKTYRQQRQRHGNLMLGLTLILAGSLFLLDKLAYLQIRDYWFLIPAVVALNGLIDIVTASKARHVAEGCSTLVIAAWLYVSIEHLWGLNFFNSWPMLLIAWGLRYLIDGLFSRHHQTGE